MTGATKTYEPLPENEYLLAMDRVEEVATKNGKGRMLKTSFKVIGGEFENRLVFQQFITRHTSAMAQKIGNEQITKFLKAVGVDGGLDALGHDLSQLGDYTGIPFIGKLVVEEPQEYVDAQGITRTSKAKNKVVAFKAR